MVWASGKSLRGGKYTVERVLGRGRLDITYVVKDGHGDRWLLKTPNDEIQNGKEFDRLQEIVIQEANKLAQCRHDRIIRAEAPFREDGLWCVPMEYVFGADLSMRDRPILPEAEALSYIRQVGEALEAVHASELLHRDVQPKHIFVRVGKAEAVLSGFSLARKFDQDITQTRTEELSDGYAPLELYTSAGERGPFTDVYSLGATLYNLLTGVTPVSADRRRLTNANLEEPKGFNPEISDRVNRAILWAMELDTNKRPQTVKAWLADLPLPPIASEEIANTPARASRFDWKAIAAVATAIGALLGGLGGFMTGLRRCPQPNAMQIQEQAIAFELTGETPGARAIVFLSQCEADAVN